MRIWQLINAGVYDRRYREQAGEGGDGGGQGNGSGDNGGGSDNGGDGGDSSPFSGLESTLVESLAKDGISDVAGLAKQFVDQKAYLGNAIRIPSEEASAEDRQAFYDKLTKAAPNLMPTPDSSDADAMNALWTRLGRPDESTGYEGVEVPEGLQFSDERLATMQGIAHKHGLTKDQFKGMVNDVLAADATQQAAMAQETADSRKTLEAEWGATFSDRESQAIAMMERTGAPEILVNMAKEKAIGGETLAWFHKLAESVTGGEGGPQIGQDQGGSGKMTPAEAQAQISEIMNNRQHPYWDMHHPEHQQAIQKMLKLSAYADPSASTTIDALRGSIDVNAS
tara:strand:- start:13954 stop:14970 length:1017 start_codon:yes stop_codon:yes gene_type:complete